MIAPERIILSLDLDATWLVTSSTGLCAGKLHIMVTSTLRRIILLKYASNNVQVHLCEMFTAARRCETSAESRLGLIIRIFDT